MTTTNTPKRHRARWNVQEINNLHNEFENKELTVKQISELHGRTEDAILYKLRAEGLIDSAFNKIRTVSNNNDELIELDHSIDDDNDDDPSDEDYIPEEDEDEDDDEDDEDDEEEEFDPYSIKQKLDFFEKQIKNIQSFLSKTSI